MSVPIKYHLGIVIELAQQRLTKAFHDYKRPIVSTSFGKNSAIMLHLASSIKPNIDTIWVDTGFVNEDTQAHRLLLTKMMSLNVHIARNATISASMLPDYNTNPIAFEKLRQELKIKPFDELIKQLGADLWISGLMAEETAYRKTLNYIETGTPDKLYPLLEWTSADCENYMDQYHLPKNLHYIDVFKPKPHLECGLHNR